MSKRTAVSVIATILILAALGGYWFFTQNTPKTPQTTLPVQTPSQEATASGIQTSFLYKCEQGKNAYDRLLETYPSIETEDTSFGKLVTSIAGVTQGNGKYWLYFVNDKEATVGAQAYICQNQEQIKWELR